MPYPYTPPAFLAEQSVDEIHRRMLDSMPEDNDKSEAQFAWDFTRPAALEKAELAQFELNETIKAMFPHWAEDEWLDYHGDMVALKRHPANKAYGYLTVTATPDVIVEAGYQFATAANLSSSIIYEATETVCFDDVEVDGKPSH